MPRRTRRRNVEPIEEPLSPTPDMRYTHAMQELRRSNASARHRNKAKYRRRQKYGQQNEM